MSRIIKFVTAFLLVASLCACKKETAKADVTSQAQGLLTAMQEGNYETAMTYVDSETVLTRVGFSNYKTQFVNLIVTSIKGYTGVETIDGYAPEFKQAIEKYAQTFLDKFLDSYTLNDDFKKESDTKATISAKVNILDGSSANYTNAYNTGFSKASEYSKEYANQHPEFVQELQSLMKTDSKAAYKKLYEVIFTAFFNEKSEEFIDALVSSRTDKTWTLTFEKKDNKWVATSIS